MLTPEELARNEQIGALFRNRAAGGSPRRMPNAEIEQLIAAAEIIGGGRAQGLEDGETIQRFVRQLVGERDRRGARGGRGQEALQRRLIEAERDLVGRGMAADDGDALDLAGLLEAEKEFGFNDERNAQLVADAQYNDNDDAGGFINEEKRARLLQDANRKNDNYDYLRAEIAKARKIRRGPYRERMIKQLEGKLAERQENQLIFDAGVGRQQDARIIDFKDPADKDDLLKAFDADPLNPRLQALVEERAAAIEGGRRMGMRGQQFVGEPLQMGPNLRGQPGVAVPDGDFIQQGGELKPVPQGYDKERGGFVKINGQRFWREGGKLYESPDDPRNIEARPMDIADEIYRPDVVGNDNSERRRLKEQDRAMGQSAVREFERFERGDLTPIEMERIARLEAGRQSNDVLNSRTPDAGRPRPAVQGPRQLKSGIDAYGRREVYEVPLPYNDEGFRTPPVTEPNPAEYDIRPQRSIGRRPFGNEVSPEDAQAAILGQLQSRKEANRAGRRDRIMAANNEDAGLEAVILGNEERLRGKAAAEAQQDIRVLGQLKGDKFKKDMGLQLGSQRVPLGEAFRMEMPDGSFRYVDVNGQDLAAPKPSQAPNPSEFLNAPDGANNAYDFVEKNQFQDRGAQFFGDEAILGQMNDKGAGGGIEQVDIGGALRGIEEKVAKRLDQPAKRVNGIRGFQNMMNAVIANERERGNALIRLEDGKKVKVDNPGVEEALMALKVFPAEQKQIANALIQQELAQKARFDPKSLAGDVRDPDVRLGPNPENVVFGVNDPKRGGDRTEFAKDIALQGKIIRQGIDGEAAKPFIALEPGAPRRAGTNQVYQGMDPVELRVAMEKRNRGNRRKADAKARRQGKRIKPFGKDEQRAEAGRIREMQEGNVLARERANRDAAAQRARGEQNARGEFVSPVREAPAPINELRSLRGRARPEPTDPVLLDRPVYPGRPANPEARKVNPSPNVVAQGEPAPGTIEGTELSQSVQGPRMGTGPRTEQQNRDRRSNQVTQLKEAVRSFAQDDKYRRGRRIGYGVGGGAAALATILNLNKEEEEQI